MLLSFNGEEGGKNGIVLRRVWLFFDPYVFIPAVVDRLRLAIEVERLSVIAELHTINCYMVEAQKIGNDLK